MTEIINGKKYCTETAAKLAEGGNGLHHSNFRWCEEALYRKKNGEFFLAGQGGPRSKYAEEIEPRTWSDGSRIIPLTTEESKRWVEKNCSSRLYEELFGPAEE